MYPDLVCLFVTAVLPARADPAMVSALAPTLVLRPLANPHVRRQLAAGEEYFSTGRDCDCGSLLGSARRAGGSPAERLARKAAAHRKAGWSEAKLARWLASQRAGTVEGRGHGAPRADGEAWLAVARAVAEGELPGIGVLLHVYRGGLATEVVTVAREERLVAGEVDLETLAGLEVDVVYRLVRRMVRRVAT